MTIRPLRVLAHLVPAMGAAAVGMLVLGAPVAAQAPSVAAWWNVANAGGDAPAPPPPPDVKDGDLYVSGSNSAATPLSPPVTPPPVPPLPPLTPAAGPAAAPSLPGGATGARSSRHRVSSPVPAPGGNAPGSAQAVAGLEFTVPRGAFVGALRLKVDGTPPPQSSVIACQATRNFTGESNGPWSDVPPYTCRHQAAGTLEHGSLVFDQIGSLARGTTLAIVLVPGPLDRVVLRAPGPSALEVSAGAPPPLGPPPGPRPGSSSGNPVRAEQGSGAGYVPPVASGGGGGGGAAGFSAPAGAPAVPKPAKLAQPGLAAPNAGPQATAQAPVPAAATVPLGPLTTTSRRIIAAAIVAAELAGFLLLHRGRRGPKPLAVPTLGGRLRPPDTASAAAAEPVERGVGRFARVRDHTVPRL